MYTESSGLLAAIDVVRGKLSDHAPGGEAHSVLADVLADLHRRYALAVKFGANGDATSD